MKKEIYFLKEEKDINLCHGGLGVTLCKEGGDCRSDGLGRRWSGTPRGDDSRFRRILWIFFVLQIAVTYVNYNAGGGICACMELIFLSCIKEKKETTKVLVKKVHILQEKKNITGLIRTFCHLTLIANHQGGQAVYLRDVLKAETVLQPGKSM